MRHLLCIFIIIFGSIGVSRSSDFQRGLLAVERGDYESAFREWLPLAEEGDATAQANLGVFYQFGYGVKQNYLEALKWFELSEKQGNEVARKQLGIVSVLIGEEMQKENEFCDDIKLCEEALQYYYKAAQLGNADGQEYMGVFHHFGYGVSLDYKEASRWYELSAKQGNASAKRQLGTVFVLIGEDIIKGNEACNDIERCDEAVHYFYKAAELGNADAMLKIPDFLIFLGTKHKDKVERIRQKMVMWWILADRLGVSNKRLKKNTKILLKDAKQNASRFNAAEQMALECIRKNYKDC